MWPFLLENVFFIFFISVQMLTFLIEQGSLYIDAFVFVTNLISLRQGRHLSSNFLRQIYFFKL